MSGLRLRSARLAFSRFQSLKSPLYLNPHEWKGLPADRVFELHELRKTNLGDKYVPSDAERNAILATFEDLRAPSPVLTYGYELDNFKERYMNNTPSNLRGLPPKLSNVRVFDKGQTPHEKRKIEQVHRVSAYEMPLLAKYRQEYKPAPRTANPIRLTYNTDFSDETNSYNRKVTLEVRLQDLGLSEPQAHKFKVLAGNKFNHNKEILRFSSTRFAEATQNARFLVESFNRLLTEAKDLSKNTFEDLPVDKRHTKPTKKAPVFPESWKRPQDAPEQKHRVLRRLLDEVIAQKDQDYIVSVSGK